MGPSSLATSEVGRHSMTAGRGSEPRPTSPRAALPITPPRAHLPPPPQRAGEAAPRSPSNTRGSSPEKSCEISSGTPAALVIIRTIPNPSSSIVALASPLVAFQPALRQGRDRPNFAATIKPRTRICRRPHAQQRCPAASTRFASGFRHRLASRRAEPARAGMKPPACWIVSNAVRSVMRSFVNGKASTRNGSYT